MAAKGGDWLGPGEAAKRLGVSVKALRVYEREGLIEPARTSASWRVYGPEHLARLHLIVVLRDLGLPLKIVRSLLRHKTPSLVAVLTVQQEALEAKRTRIERAIRLLTSARGDLAAGRALSLDDLTQLSRETMMSEDMLDTETRSRIKTLFDQHTDVKDRTRIKDIIEKRMEAIGKSKQDMLDEARILLAEGRKAMEEGDPDSEAAKSAVRRWHSLFGPLITKDDALRSRLGKATEAIFANPAIASRLPVDFKVATFLRTVARGMRASGELD